MKLKYLLFVICVTNLLYSCKNDNDPQVSTVKKTIDSQVQFINYSYKDSNPCIGTYSFDTTAWHSFAVSISSITNVVKMYIDGKVITSNYIYSGHITPTNSLVWSKLYIGASNVTTFSEFYKGQFDELRISNCVRTDEEISNTFKNKVEFTSDTYTAALWHFDNSIINVVNKTVGSQSGDVTFNNGVFGKCLDFKGINGYIDCKYDMPERDVTIEFWAKFNGSNITTGRETLLQPYGMYSGNIAISK